MFKIENLTELVERARRAFRINLPGSDAWLWPNNVNPTAKVIGGMTHEVFGFADYIQRQKFALTADGENLDLHGEELGMARRPAAPARCSVSLVVPGAVAVAAGARFRRGDGVDYLAVSGGSTTGAATLVVDAVAAIDGVDGTPTVGAPLEVIAGVSGASASSVAVSAIVMPGADVEDDETFRARILFRKRNPPHGGSAADYVLWTAEVAGVSFYQSRPSVFVERLWTGAGTVRIFPLMYDLYTNGIPGAADLQRVKDHLELLRPAGAQVTVAAPVAVPINIQISGLAPNRLDVREAVVKELRDAFRRLSRVAGVDSEIAGMPYLAYPTSFSRSWIWQAVANASGEQRHVIAAPSADQALSAGQMAVLGTVTFI